jgi:hypothetical protein
MQTKLKKSELVWGILTLALLGSALAHRLQLGDTAAYTHSLLIPVELTLTLVLLVFLLIDTLLLVNLLFRKKWQRLGRGLVIWLLGILAIGLAVGLDSATLLYMS